MAQKTVRHEALRVVLEWVTGALCRLSIFVLGICASFLERDWRLALRPYDLGVEATNHIFCAVSYVPEGVHVAQWAKRPPLKLEVLGSNLRGWFNGRAGNRDPFR